MTHTVLILQLAIVMTLQSGACRNNKMNNNQHSEPSPNGSNVTSPPQGSRLAMGVWSGPDIVMDVNESGARVEFVCAHGILSEPLILKEGRFTIPGTFVRERGGPTREGQSEKGTPVSYRGEFDGERLTLKFSLAADGSDPETFSLTRGSHGRLIKCK